MSRPGRALAALTLGLFVWQGGGASPARADGAFPDSQSILTPAALPHEIALATNFGLVLSTDDGGTWTWTCEQTLNAYGGLYQMGAPPRNRLYAVAPAGLVFSDDSACTWSLASGAVSGMNVLDAFPDPSNPDRVFVVAAETADGGITYALFESIDGGATVSTLRYTADAGDHITGVEIARSDPTVVYVTLTSGTTFTPKLGRSTDGGKTWQLHDLGAALGAGITSIRLMAVDPQDATRAFLRVGGAAGELIAVTSDGGATVQMPLSFPGGIVSAFARLDDGRVIVGGVMGVDPVAFASSDHGATFTPLPAPPHLRALGARGALLYAVADDVADGYAIATSTDEGMTWKPLMRYDQIQAIQACAKAQCQTDCLARADLDQWPTSFCSADAPTTSPPETTDGGVGHPDGDAAISDAAAGTTGDASRTGSTAPPSGCHCEAVNARLSGREALLAVSVLAGALLSRRRRRSR